MNRRRCVCVLALLAATALGLAARPVAAGARVIDLAIRGGTLPLEQRLIRVQQGDVVTLRWTSDRVLTLHLHGYDVEQRVVPGTPATMTFTARATGRFAIEVHGGQAGRDTTLAYLEVHPR
jgi:FtsP/CotA-like multicopper oxidase with cupredoxin domain